MSAIAFDLPEDVIAVRDGVLRFVESEIVQRVEDQSGEPPLALDQRESAQVVAVPLNQIERDQYRLMATALAPQRIEVRRATIAGDHRLAVDQG